MRKSGRLFVIIGILAFLLATIPLSRTESIRSSVYSFLKPPIAASRNMAQTVKDLFYFYPNAQENRSLRKSLDEWRLKRFENQELVLENERLKKLMELRTGSFEDNHRVIYSKVIGRSSSPWNRVLLIDKGASHRMRVNMAVMSSSSVIGKIVDVGPSVSKVRLVNDPNSKIGVLIQRTRQHGILFGTLSGECRIKYLSLDSEIKPGDLVETGGYSGFFPKGLPVGRAVSAGKEPGQIYQVAQVRLFTDLSQIEEVACVDL